MVFPPKSKKIPTSQVYIVMFALLNREYDFDEK